MKNWTKKALSALLCLFLFGSVFVTAASASDTKGISGYATVDVYMNGKQVLVGRSLLIDSVTYVPLRSFSELIGGGTVSWDAKTRTAYIKNGTRVVSATDGHYYINADGRYFYTVERIRIINDTMYVPIRPIARAFGINVGWDSQKRSVTLKDTGILPASGSKYYNADDLYWLSRIISSESRGESLKGQIAVGNVVLNRVKSTAYPNTVYGVIFDKRGGTQFSPVSFGTIYDAPAASSVIAAKICLEGYTLSDEILFFMNPKTSTSNWISKNRTFEFRIGNHDFYS